MKSIKYLLLFCCATIAMYSQAQNVQVNVIVQPLPSPYFADWEIDDQIAEIHFNADFQQPVNVILEITVNEDQFGNIFRAQSEIIQLDQGSWNLVLNNPNMFNWPLVEYNPIVNQYEGASRIPDGNYSLCARVINTDDNNEMGNGCGYFSVLLPEPPQITSPVNGQSCNTDNLLIQWFPVQWIPGHPVFYNVTITEILPNQMPQEAWESNPPHFEMQVEDVTVMLYPFDALPLEPGLQYAVVVQSVDEFGDPIGSNSGYSQVEFCAVNNNNNTVFVYPWQKDVDRYTDDDFLKNITLQGDPCDSIRALINKLQNRLIYVLFKQGEAKDKSDKAKNEKAKAEKDSKKADDDLKDAKDDLKKANADRKTILNAMVKASGGKWGTWNNGKSDCGSAVVIGPSNGDLQLGGNNAICLGANQVNSFLEQMNKWRKDLKALNKRINKAEKAKADAEKRKADAEGRKSKAEKDQKAADKDYEKWKKEAEALKDALDKLKKLADECDIVIENLQKKYDAAKEKIDEAVNNLNNAQQNGGGGKNSKDDFDKAQDKIDEANKHLKNGDYEKAEAASEEANGHTSSGTAWAGVEDCLKEAKEKLKAAKEKLAAQKAEYPGGDFSKAEAAIAQAEKYLAEAEDAYKNGDIERVKQLCPKIKKNADDGGDYAGQVTCNEGDEKEIKNKLVDEHFVGTLTMPYGVDPDNLGYQMKEFLAAIGDPGGISGYVDMLYGLSSVSYAKTIYDMYYEKRCTEVLVCKNGEWVHKEYKDCYEGLVPRVKLEMVLDEIDLKERLKGDLTNIYKELKKYLKK
jgi:hypothetical protein